MDARLQAAHTKLKQLRERQDLSLKPTPLLKQTFTDFDGTEKPLQIRYYQVQGILHLVAMNRFLLGDDTGIGKCCVGSTLVLTDHGLWPIASLRAKGWEAGMPEEGKFEEALPFKVWTGRCWARIKSWYYDGVRPSIRVRSACRYEVEGSHRHPLLVRSADGEHFQKLSDLRDALRNCPTCEQGHVFTEHGCWVCGDCGAAWDRDPCPDRPYVCIERRESIAWPEEDPPVALVARQHGSRANHYDVPDRFSPELGRLLGYYVAEGHSANKYGFTITQHHKESHDDIRGLLRNVLGWEGDHGAANRDQEITVSSIVLRAFLDDCGAHGGKSGEKEVPSRIFHCTRETVCQFLRGLFEGDAHVGPNAIEYCSKSMLLVRGVQTLLLRFGIVSSQSKKYVDGEVYWRLFIQGDDARQYARTIGFVTARKEEALLVHDGKRSNPNLDVIPHVAEPVGRLWSKLVEATRVRGANGAHRGSGVKQFGDSLRNTVGFVKRGERNLTYQKLDELLAVCADFGLAEDPDYQALHEVRTNRYFYDPIQFIEEPGTAHLMDLEVDDEDHSFVGNGLVNHNTIQSIAGLCYVWANAPDMKVVVLTNKSVVGQWALEFDKFCTPGEINVIVCVGTPAKREKIYKEFEAATGPTVLIMGYATARRDIKHIQDWKDFVFITDEASAYKNPSTQTYQVVRHLGSQASRFWALTATLIKNNLIEGYAIYSLVVPGLFGTSKNKFMNEYCLTRLQPIPGGRGRQVPVIIGYRSRDIDRFREKIDPYFLSRAKFDVAKELPVLTIREHKCSMTREQKLKYEEALSGLLEIDRTSEEKEIEPLTALIYCQEIVDHPDLIECEGDSDKMKELFELLTEGDFLDEKVIVFSRFRKMVDILEKEAKKKKISCVRVTGSENEDQRKVAMQEFQDPESDVRVCFITEAAKEGINLQAAKALIFYDSPWSAGDYIQILGRMIRIGSKHDRCYAIHMVAKGTIDVKVMGVLRKKMKLIEQVMGKRLKGDDMDDFVVGTENSIDDLFQAMVQDARKYA
jgi:intein/homing endonuclease